MKKKIRQITVNWTLVHGTLVLQISAPRAAGKNRPRSSVHISSSLRVFLPFVAVPSFLKKLGNNINKIGFVEDPGTNLAKETGSKKGQSRNYAIVNTQI